MEIRQFTSERMSYPRKNAAPICPQCGTGRIYVGSSQGKRYCYCMLKNDQGKKVRNPDCDFSKCEWRGETN